MGRSRGRISPLDPPLLGLSKFSFNLYYRLGKDFRVLDSNIIWFRCMLELKIWPSRHVGLIATGMHAIRGSRTICRRTIRRGQLFADKSSRTIRRGQFAADNSSQNKLWN